MKPLKLTLQAFGPFSGLQEIDFRLLGESPLFLINGPTGSGKSSILDAICFALYGRTTSDEREASEMRCDNAHQNTPTEVTLDFELAGKHYRVSRAPQQQRPKARGEGTTTDNGFATLWQVLKNGELKLIVAKKLKEVTLEIENITGLNVEQFRQVMVLPQGKFRELLLADSREREKIFGQLFQTHIYKRIEDSLQQQASKISYDVKSLNDQIKGILQTAEVNTEDEIHQQLDSSKPVLKQLVQQKEQAQQSYQNALQQQEVARALVKQFEELEMTRQKISKLLLQQPDIDHKHQQLDKAVKAEKLKPHLDELIRVETEYRELENQITHNRQTQKLASHASSEAQVELEQAQVIFKDVDRLKQNQQLILQYQDRIIQLDKVKKASSVANENRDASTKKLTVMQKELDVNTTEIDNLEQKLSSIQQLVSGLGNKQVQLAELKRQNEKRQKLEVLQTDLKSHSSKLKSALQRLDAKSKIARSSLQIAIKQEMLWHSGQAINLAKELELDQPCPVCGSTDHPSPAMPDDNQPVVSKKDVASARTQAEADKTHQLDIEKQVNTFEIELKQIEKDITDSTQHLGELAESSVEQVETSFKALQSEVITVEQQQKGMLEINEQLLTNKSIVEKLKLKLLESQQQNEQLKNQAIQEQAAVDLIASEIPQEYQNTSILADELQQVTALIKQMTSNLDSANEHAQQCKIELVQIDTSYTNLINRIAILNENVMNTKSGWLQNLHDSIFDNEEELQYSLLTEDEQLKLTVEIAKFTDQIQQWKGALKQQENELTDKKEPDLDTVNDVCSQMEQKYKVADKEWHELGTRVKPLQTAQKLLKQAHDKNAALEASYAIYGTLSDVANGKTYNKISLQRFVLSVLLDDVLIQASQRLSLMSKGRYQMLRKDARAKGNKASGLELEVEDAYTGKTRSVATLSGGESFMAALALALGLSDVVQAYAGGIKLDTLFIDEGFGSLDQESLDLAIRTLIDLQATGRMIGIISHVTELKEQMALRLDVVSSKTGSSIKCIHTN